MPDKGSIIARGGWSRILGNSIYQRCWWTACILMIECVMATALPHAWLQGQSGFTDLGQPVTLAPLPFRWLQARTVTTSIIFFCVALLFFGRDKLKALPWSVSPLHKGWVVLHACALAAFVETDYYLTNTAVPGTALEHGAMVVWYGSLLVLPVTLGGALIHLPKPFLLLRSLGNAWGLAAICDLLMMSVRSLLILAWDRPHSWLGHRMQVATFHGVTLLLGFIYPNVFRDPGRFMIGTNTFSVVVADQCSGVEGLALMLSLTVGWLLFMRRELRLRRALLLVPVALYLSWLLNMVRIAALIAIGNSGYAAVALGGFHTQAGWILFSCVGLGFLITVNNVSWFRRSSPALATHPSAHPQAASASVNIAAIYLLPWLAILATGILAQAASDGFEWLYPLRLVAALAVFFLYRRKYLQMDWRFSWMGPAAGLLVFAFWIAIDQWVGQDVAGRDAVGSGVVLTSVAAGLTRLSSSERALWIALRTLAAVVTVPLAEELAFRGYIARRFMSADVESIPFASLSLFAVVASSLAFGILHGRMWLAGVLAGVVFAVVAKLRGRLGDAVVAHATANLLLALWVIARGDYALW
ncbi:MAG TPA: exosortase E/protease, VPEID-CTERM system [Acidobacteriaceae bacterium]|nr:exosortase E/protease, VPEID-CTERM system [Acidobacteriaceae bacterium]